MSQHYDNVIIFGPTGAVGSAAAIEASKRGAHVWLAMRDPSKPINGLTADQEKQGKFTRVQADLTDTASVEHAVRTSGAKAAFVYRVQTPDNMLATLQAMNAAGVTYIVFLSSFTIERGKDMSQIPSSRFIPYVHARIEMNLDDLKIPHVALRPGDFASNVNFQLDRSDSTSLVAHVVNGNRLTDKIVPKDIGILAGTVLVNPPSSLSQTPKEIMYVYGPKLMNYDEMWETTKKVTGENIKVEHPDREAYIETMMSRGTPRSAAESSYDLQQYFTENTPFTGDHHERAVENFRKYTGREMTSFEEYLSGVNLK